MTSTAIEPLMTLGMGGREIGLTTASMRTEQRKGRLSTIKIAGKHYVTHSLLREFVQRCRVEPKAQDSTLVRSAEAEPAGGLSETELSKLARDAALKTVQGLKKLSRAT